MKKKICPVCGKEYIKHGFSFSPSGYKSEYWTHGYAKNPLFKLGDIPVIEEFACSRLVKQTEEQMKKNKELYEKRNKIIR